MLSITAQVTAGSSITDAFTQAIALADKLNCFVEFDFNGVMCLANPGGNVDAAVRSYQNAIKSNYKTKFAFS